MALLIYVAIGANLPGPDGADAQTTCRRAAAALDGVLGLHLVAVSGWYATAPVPASDQPDYVNGVAALSGEADPAALLAALQAIEAAHGRVRGAANAARTLDLDIVAMGALVRTAPDPVLPHPRMHARAFVLRPLAELAPGWVHPVSGLGVGELLAAVSRQPVRQV